MFHLLPGSVSIYTSEDLGLALKAIVRDLRLQGYESANIYTSGAYKTELERATHDRNWTINAGALNSDLTIVVCPIVTNTDSFQLSVFRTLVQKSEDILILVSDDPKIQNTRLTQEVDNLIVVEAGMVTYAKARNQVIEPKTVSLKD